MGYFGVENGKHRRRKGMSIIAGLVAASGALFASGVWVKNRVEEDNDFHRMYDEQFPKEYRVGTPEFEKRKKAQENKTAAMYADKVD